MEIGSVRLGPARHTMILGNHCEITTLIAQDHETEGTAPGAAAPPRPPDRPAPCRPAPAPDSARPGVSVP